MATTAPAPAPTPTPTPHAAWTKASRAVAVFAAICAAIVMGTSSQTVTYLSSTRETKVQSNDLTCFQLFVIANSTASIYGFFTFLLKIDSLLWRLVVVLDLLVAMILASISSAALGMIYMEREGNTHAFWPPICDHAKVYCDHVTAAIALSFFGASIYSILFLYVTFRVLNPLLIHPPKA